MESQAGPQPVDQRPEEGGAPRAPWLCGAEGLEGKSSVGWKQTPLLEVPTEIPDPSSRTHKGLGQTWLLVLGVAGRGGAGAGSSCDFTGDRQARADALGVFTLTHSLLEADVSLRWLAPRAGLGLQPVGSRARTPEAKWPPGQGHGPALQQTGCPA